MVKNKNKTLQSALVPPEPISGVPIQRSNLPAVKFLMILDDIVAVTRRKFYVHQKPPTKANILQECFERLNPYGATKEDIEHVLNSQVMEVCSD